MIRNFFSKAKLGVALIVLSSFLISCSTQATSRYWGQTTPPKENVMRYITGSEPESLDPQFVTGQPEARILIGLFDRLVEYHPKTMEPIPSMATHWEVSEDATTYTFHLRKDGRFSNGDPITAEDFAWSFRRALSPELASRYAFLGYDIKYGEAFNADKAFVKKNGQFVLERDVNPEQAKKDDPIAESKPPVLRSESPTQPVPGDVNVKEEPKNAAADAPKPIVNETEFQKFINAPARLTVPADEEERAKAVKDNPKLKAILEGAEFVPVEANNIGVEAVDPHTLRVTLKAPAPYFTGLITHQFFGALHRPSIEKHGKDWIKPENIITSGAFKVDYWRPYDELRIVKNPMYWDAENVSLDAIVFYPMDEQTTMMNLYKSGRVDALYNHTVPAAWNETIRQYKHEYLLHPEITIEYYTFSVNKPPVDKVPVRKAFSLAIDRDALEKYRKTIKKSANFTPEGILPKYEEVRKEVFADLRKEKGISDEEWEKRFFNPAKACQLMKEAGYEVTPREEGRCTVKGFPADDISLSYNTAESNKQVAEFVQAQWKQNLGITVPLKNMEWKTYLPYRSGIEYKGMARAGWVGDYMDPFTFLSQFYTKNNDSSTGWWNAEYDKLLEDANKTLDQTERLKKLARAEFLMLQDQPVIPLSTAGTSWMKKPYIKGMYPNPGTMHPWKFVYIERDPNKWHSNVDNIMQETDPRVEAHVSQLTKTQEQFEKSQQSEKENQTTAKAE